MTLKEDIENRVFRTLNLNQPARYSIAMSIRDDVKKAVLKDEENLIQLIGELSGLGLVYDISDELMQKINTLSTNYATKKHQLYGNFDDKEQEEEQEAE